MKLKKIIVLLIAFIFTASLGYAQQKKSEVCQKCGECERIDHRVQKMQKELSLSDVQTKKVKALFNKQKNCLLKQKDKVDKTKEDLQKMREQQRTITQNELKKILTSDQYNRFVANKKKPNNNKGQKKVHAYGKK